MRRTAAGSALVCVGFALGALGATLAGPQVHRTTMAFLHAGDGPYLAVAGHTRSVPTPAVGRRHLAVRGPLTYPRAGVPAVAAAGPGTAAPDTRTTAQVGPAPVQPLGIDVSLDPARSIDAATLELYRILTGLPIPTPGQH